MEVNSETKLNVVIGFPLDHTLSPHLHNFVYEKLNINAVMRAYPSLNLQEIVNFIKSTPIHLCAVTMPHKIGIMNFLDQIDDLAQKIGMVNTVVNKNGKLIGYNTDIAGIQKALANVEIKNKNVLLIGAGGAARAVAFYIKEREGNIYYFNRTRIKAEVLAKNFGGKVLEQSDLRKKIFALIVNATPVGVKNISEKNMSEMLVPVEILKFDQTVFDLVYNPLETELIQQAKKAGAKIISGLTMFTAQGLEQIKLWSQAKINEDLAQKTNLEILKQLL